MGMRYFSVLTGKHLGIYTPKPLPGKRPGTEKAFLMPTAKEITLAEYNEASSGAITAHRLSDYRRRKFSLVLLPNIHIPWEDLIAVAVDTGVPM